jgi:hypothetical protein
MSYNVFTESQSRAKVMVQTIDKTQDSSSEISLDQDILKVLANLSDSLKIEVLHYAEYLLQKNSVTEKNIDDDQLVLELPETESRKSLMGCMKGTFVLPLPDDFNEPLDDFAEHM